VGGLPSHFYWLCPIGLHVAALCGWQRLAESSCSRRFGYYALAGGHATRAGAERAIGDRRAKARQVGPAFVLDFRPVTLSAGRGRCALFPTSRASSVFPASLGISALGVDALVDGAAARRALRRVFLSGARWSAAIAYQGAQTSGW